MRRIALLLAVVVAACGGGKTVAVVPPKVPTDAVPAALTTAGGLLVRPNTAAEIDDAFRVAGRRSLVREGKVWELRKGDELIGALQLSSLTARVDTTREDDREAVRGQILPGSQSEWEVATIPVWSSRDGKHGVYVWFGKQMLGVLQVKGDDTVDPDDTATELITAIFEANSWPGLPPEAFDPEDD